MNLQRSDSITNLAASLVKAQAALEPVKKDTENPFFSSRYADLTAIIEEVRPRLAEHGLTVLQFPGALTATGASIRKTDSKTGEIQETPLGSIELTTIIMHESGEFISDTLALPFAMTGAQAAGSAITYARRYGLQAVLGIAAEDDFGNGASGASSRSNVPLTDVDLCPVHKKPWLHRVGTYKEGHAKAGQTYDFWACGEKDGNEFCKQWPPKGYSGPGAAASEAGGGEDTATGDAPEPLNVTRDAEGAALCDACANAIPEQRVQFCATREGRALCGGSVLCFACQKLVQKQKGGQQ